MKTRIQQLATEMAGYFEARTHAKTGASYVALKDSRPQWMQDVAMQAHAGMWPDDWRYGFVRAAVDALAEGGELDDAIENNVCTNTMVLCHWLASHIQRVSYVDEAVRREGITGTDLYSQLQAGQHAELTEVFAIVERELETIAKRMELAAPRGWASVEGGVMVEGA